MNYKIKIILGFRENQIASIDSEEAHKAYYLFLHPTERGVFNDGMAIRGSDIQRIEPDYQGSMGWNPTHELDNDDWNEIRGIGLDGKLRQILSQAQELARLDKPPINKPMSEAIKILPQSSRESIDTQRGGIKSISEILGK